MFMQLYLNDSYMIRKNIVAAVPAALVAVGISLAISEPASGQFSNNYQQNLLNSAPTTMMSVDRGFGTADLPSEGFYTQSESDPTTGPNQIYPNANRNSGGMGF